MDWLTTVDCWAPVALRKESVDRNTGGFPTIKAMRGSLSARRAWIEICIPRSDGLWQEVALRKESVDRNLVFVQDYNACVGRSPQGERG